MQRDSDYSSYTAEEFSFDASFQAYVLASDEADVEFWQSWIAQHPEKKEEVALAIKMLDALYTRLPQGEMEQELGKFKARIQSGGKATVSPPADNQRRLWGMNRFVRYAAVLVLLAVSGFVVYTLINHYQSASQQNNLASRLVEKSTTRGQKSIITLMDGTQIKLNAESKITFPESFDDSVRWVELEGEAYFEVAKNLNVPFVVKCGNFYTKVLGTSFNINAYPENKKIDVALVEGKVQVYMSGPKKSGFYLQPDEKASYDKDNKDIVRGSFDPHETVAWKDGIISFKKASFEEMKLTLERWYDVKFIVSKQPSMQGFTGEFKNQSLDAVLEGISFSVGFKFKLQGKRVFIY